jgi:hypothetical protein
VVNAESQAIYLVIKVIGWWLKRGWNGPKIREGVSFIVTSTMSDGSEVPKVRDASQTSGPPVFVRNGTMESSTSSNHAVGPDFNDLLSSDRNHIPGLISPLRSRTPKVNNRPFPGTAIRIQATTTAAQNEIYKLERRLEKLFQQHITSHGAHASFISQENTMLEKNQTTATPITNRILHPLRQGTANLGSSGPLSLPVDSVTASRNASAFLLNNISEIIKQHPGATRLPMIHDVLGALEIPFSSWPLEG